MATPGTTYFRPRDLRALLTLEEALAANARQFVLLALLSMLTLVVGGGLAIYVPLFTAVGTALAASGLGLSFANWLRYQYRAQALLTQVQLLST